jgi:hypothetical protein
MKNHFLIKTVQIYKLLLIKTNYLHIYNKILIKMKDSDLLKEMISSLETNAYDFGAFINFNGLDVQNLKNPVFGK